MNLPAQNTEKPGNLDDSVFQVLANARSIFKKETQELARFSENIPIEFAKAVRMLSRSSGAIIVSGIGKAGWIGQKISATLSSTGTRSHFLHAAEAFHGDFGRVQQKDTLLILSHSGETKEIVEMVSVLRQRQIETIAITASSSSSLGHSSDCTIAYGNVPEACTHGLAPSTSTTLMLTIGDALALTVSQIKKFSPMDFAEFHPGGSLGLKLTPVEDAMRPIHQCRTARTHDSVRKSIAGQGMSGRRSGAILVLDSQGLLAGIFTDSDLVRQLEKRKDQFLDLPISTVMTPNPIQLTAGNRVGEAIEILSSRSISELPIVDPSGIPLGLIDITDVIA